MQTRRVIIPYSPRKQFLPLHNRSQRFSVIVAHRRAGKTVACINELIKGALSCKGKNPRFAYIAPLYKQAKDVAWAYLKEYTQPIPGTQVNESELRIDLPNGGRVRLYGADNPDTMRGIYLDGVILDEFADMNPRMWSEVVRPALSDRKGWAIFIGTPKGHNEFYKLYNNADDTWYTATLRASETGLVDADELLMAQKDMTPEQYAQEFECSFHAAITGAYYGREIAAAEDDNRITSVPYQPGHLVYTAWDLGIGDATAIWFYQLAGREIHIIDYLESTGKGLDYYVKELHAKTYIYGDHNLPHDVEVRELGTGRTRLETLKNLGLKAKIVPKLPVDDGINAVRLLLPRCWIDKTKCADGIEALRQYRADFDDKKNTYSNRPRHDWTSHAADAFRYLAIGMKEKAKPKVPVYSSGSWMGA